MWSFVDLFFVLSGFLITGILLRLETWDPINLRNFWVRRILRIWPVYYLTLVGVLALWFAWQLRHDQPLTGFNGYRESVVFLQYLIGDYATLPAGVNYLWWFGHSWSLAVEEQFYLVWPLLLWAVRHRPAFGVALLASFLIGVVWFRATSHMPDYLLLTRADGLVFGSLIAVLMDARARGAIPDALATVGCRIPWHGLLAAAALLFPYLRAGYTGTSGATHGGEQLPLLFALAYGSLVGLLLGGQLPRLARMLSWWRPLVYLGSLSYAIYMFHLPVQKLLDQFYNAGHIPHRWMVEIVFWTVVIAASAASRVLLENPAERAKKRFPLRFRSSAPTTEPVTASASSADSRLAG